ncbi:TetR/AcrR family transcriptional regulator [Streptomyces sp. NPDC004262]
MTASERPDVVRRPRMTAGREADLLEAARDVLRLTGYEALTMDAVAARGHCSKATLYRQFGTKPKMIAKAMRGARPTHPDPIDTGSLRDDLVALVHRIADDVAEVTPLVTAVSHAALRDPELAPAVRESVIAPDAAQVEEFLARAVERGELPRRPAAADHLVRLAFSVTTAGGLFDATAVDAAYLTRLIDDLVMPALLHG